ncbi:LytTR family transcriptional regulator [Lacihabitans sp. LS3-19]|uniref:LytR/AlgR family response regulator transcription factor n=1 Tax=Lacihabitans sp. LS3-19 TaxID=2487335 RepID=UPI0020CE2194|nr:LytTR family DNA-binding domain-containing protein [Lacihabitans sp. LS3-19]MCP9766432.1 LytTR family transcriptional regulator [Lacihabitans sp. LS3-19]
METQKMIHIGSRKKVAPQDILYLKSDINYTRVLLVNGQIFLSSTTLKIIESRLAPTTDFLRINRGIVINIKHVKAFQNSEVELINHESFVVSRRRKLNLNF